MVKSNHPVRTYEQIIEEVREVARQPVSMQTIRLGARIGHKIMNRLIADGVLVFTGEAKSIRSEQMIKTYQAPRIRREK